MLDETALRRPDFEPGAPVTLADGQAWQLRKPRVRFVPDDDAPEGFQVFVTLPQGDNLSALLAQRQGLLRDTCYVTQIAPIELRIAGKLLLANYALTADQVRELLQFSYSDDEAADPEGVEIRDACLAVALGRGPKAEPATAE